MRYFDRWYYRAKPSTITYGWACFRLAVRYWVFLLFKVDSLGMGSLSKYSHSRFFQSLHPYSVSDDFIKNYHMFQ